MTDLRVPVLSALVGQSLKRHLPPHVPGLSIERVLAEDGIHDAIGIARTLGELQSGPWPLVELAEWGAYKLTDAGRAHLAWALEMSA